MHELATTNIRLAIDGLLHAYACANMHRSSGNPEYAKTALGWFESIEQQVRYAREDLEKTVRGTAGPNPCCEIVL
jgi:hypothetical protein